MVGEFRVLLSQVSIDVILGSCSGKPKSQGNIDNLINAEYSINLSNMIALGYFS